MEPIPEYLKVYRDSLIIKAHREHGYKVVDVARIFNLSHSTISRILL